MLKEEFFDLPHHRGQSPQHLIIPESDHLQSHLPLLPPPPVWIDILQSKTPRFPRSSSSFLLRVLKFLPIQPQLTYDRPQRAKFQILRTPIR